MDLSIKAPFPLLPPGEATATLAHSFEVAGALASYICDGMVFGTCDVFLSFQSTATLCFGSWFVAVFNLSASDMFRSCRAFRYPHHV